VYVTVGEHQIKVDVLVMTPAGTSNYQGFTYNVDQICLSDLMSPGELRVYDSSGRVTGLVNGQVVEDIPHSICDGDSVMLLYPADVNRYVVVGTSSGTYGLKVNRLGGEVHGFTALDVPTAAGAVHEYTIDWERLGRGEKCASIQVDRDGDGRFESSFSSDAVLTANEFASGTSEGRLAFWVWIIVGGVVGVVAAAGLILWRRIAKKPVAIA